MCVCVCVCARVCVCVCAFACSLNSDLKCVYVLYTAAPPNNCKSLEVVTERTRGNTITVRWERPEIIGRDDFYYNIFYSEDNQTFTQHNSRPYVKQDALVDYSVSGLQPLTTYTIRVIPENGVSGQEEGGQSRSCEVVTMTGDTSEWTSVTLKCIMCIIIIF